MNYSKNRALLVGVIVLALILTLLPIAGLVSLVQAAIPWAKYLGGLSLGGELFVMDAWVIKDGASYEMWYTHGKTALSISEIANSLTTILTDAIVNDIANQDLNALLNDLSGINVDALWNFLSATSTVVGYATSTDGINWIVVNSQVLAGAGGWDSVGFPSVIKNSATDYKMWYTHTKTSLTQPDLANILIDLGNPDLAIKKGAILALMNSTTTAIGYATSSNGTTWTQTPELLGGIGGLWDSVGFPSVIKNSATDYEMWYTNVKTSLTGTDLDTILANLAGFGADKLWNILNSTSSVIGYATSTDGINWIVVNSQVLAGGGGWDSVGFPSVIKNSATDYEMWYSHGTTDLTLTGFQTLATELLALKPDFSALWNDLKLGNLNQFLTDFTDLIDNKIVNIKALLANTSAVIGYATSGDGISWTVDNPTALVGGSGSPWSSVANPSVVYNNGLYEIWFTQGIDTLTAQNLVDLLQGTILPLGYASYEVGIDLVTGWNFIGLPRAPASPAIGDVLAGIIGEVVIVWYFDGITDTWYYFIPGGPPPTLNEMTEGKAYWIRMSAPNTLTIP